MAVDGFGLRHGGPPAAIAPTHLRDRLHLRLRPAITLAALLVLVAALGARWVVQNAADDTAAVDGQRRSALHGAADAPPDAYFDLRGGTPEASPASRLAIGFLSLDEPLQQAVDVFGSPRSTVPEINGQASTWEITGAQLTVSTWDDAQAQISGVYLQVRSGSSARFAIHGGAVIGASTLREVIDAWGPAYVVATSPFDDFIVRYTECLGGLPVVIKFDQHSARAEHPGLAADSPLWDRRVTTMLVAYADEPPGTGGCES